MHPVGYASGEYGIESWHDPAEPVLALRTVLEGVSQSPGADYFDAFFRE